MDKDKSFTIGSIESTILIVILTASSYGIAYVYQRSYIYYYKLPDMFVELNISSLTSTLIYPFITFLVIHAFWNTTRIQYSLFSEYIPSSIRNKISKIKFIKEIQSEVIKQPKRWYAWMVFIIIAIMYAFTMSLGEYRASKVKNYIVIRQEERLFVAVTSYKDSLIIAPLDLEKKSITPTFKAIETKELKDAEMIRFENGLKVEDVKNSKDLIE